jgi:alpha-ketoglutarate-dependent taurine dioxygenase
MPGAGKDDAMALTVTDLTPRIGARIETDLDTLLSGAATPEIRALLEARGVVLFRGLTMDDARQLAFTRTFGGLGDDDVGTIYKVSFDKTENPTHADYNYGNMAWHIDRTDIDLPPFASMLNAKRLVSSGGETEFASTYAAYEDLSGADKALIEDLRVVHRVEAATLKVYPDPPAELLALWSSRPAKVHPLVWHHRSGRKSLIVGDTATEVVGMDKAEGAALLDRLLAWATRPEFVYVHQWQLGDVVMWNNTGTMHRVRPYDITAGRLLHRTTVMGDEPFDPKREFAEA